MYCEKWKRRLHSPYCACPSRTIPCLTRVAALLATIRICIMLPFSAKLASESQGSRMRPLHEISIRALGSSTSRPLKLGHRSAVGGRTRRRWRRSSGSDRCNLVLRLVAVHECIVFLRESTAREYRKLFVNNKQNSCCEKLLTDVANLHLWKTLLGD